MALYLGSQAIGKMHLGDDEEQVRVENEAIVTYESLNTEPISSLILDIQGYQKGSGDASPDNIRDIVSFNRANVIQKNNKDNPIITNTYNIPFPTNVYKGQLDVTNGVLRIDWGVKDMADLNWIYSSSLNGSPAFYYVDNTNEFNAPTGSNSIVADLVTDCYRTISANNLYTAKDETGIISLNTSHAIQIRDTRYSNVTDLKAGVKGHKIAYQLATPQTYQLTPTQIKSLIGKNVLYSDIGDVIEIETITSHGEKQLYLGADHSHNTLNYE